jgi:F-type H+-transporting ATPase subunit delta
MSRGPVENYAQSLFDVASDQALIDQVGDDLAVVSALLEQEPLFLTYLGSPCFTLSQKHGFVIRVFGTELHSFTRRFISILLGRGRTELLPEVIRIYRERRDRVQGIKSVQVTVAQPLDHAREDRLERDIRDALQCEVRLSVEVDPMLLGGVLIRCDDRLIDNSLRGRLSRAVKTWNEQIKSATYEG